MTAATFLSRCLELRKENTAAVTDLDSPIWIDILREIPSGFHALSSSFSYSAVGLRHCELCGFHQTMPVRTNNIQIRPEQPCPCRSGKAVIDCCATLDNNIRVKFDLPIPRGPLTGHEHPKCYLQHTRNCSEDISREHYISRSVLELFLDQVVEIPFPWNEPGQTTRVGIENLTAKILCARHNSALSPLDMIAAQAFRNISEAAAYVSKKSLATKTVHYLVSGEGLELWGGKLLFGLYFATMATKNGAALKDTHFLDPRIFQSALERGGFADPAGLYIRKSNGTMTGGVGWMPLSNDLENIVSGLRFLLAPVVCELLVDSSGLNFDVIRRENMYRPSSIDLVGKKRQANIFLTGPGFADKESIRVTLHSMGSIEKSSAAKMDPPWSNLPTSK